MVRSNIKPTILAVMLFSLTSLLTSCASGQYYKAGADYREHADRYHKDDRQTYNDPYYRYSQPNAYQSSGHHKSNCHKKRRN